MSRETPIIFSAPMVRAILAGKKTQTRRLAWRPDATLRFAAVEWPSPWARTQPGDVLWVREACRAEEDDEGTAGVCYAADDAWSAIANTPQAAEDWLRLYTYRTGDPLTGGKLVPPIHMPRWASRITLRVTATRIERLQEISEADARAEGIHPLPQQSADDPSAWWESDYGQNQARSARASFMQLWTSLHGPGSWESNPEVVVLTFEKEPPHDRP